MLLKKSLKMTAIFSAILTLSTAAIAEVKHAYKATPAKPTSKSSVVAKSTSMPTYIVVKNLSTNYVTALVPGWSVPLAPNYETAFSSPDYVPMTALQLRDPWNVVFDNRYVCNQAIITVQGRPGYYTITEDRRYCY